jgi:predicted ATPase/class 3 adenylate cyclase
MPRPVTGIPTGTVTFLFTDIEGSTRLLQELGDEYRAVQDLHHEIVRRAFTDAGGTEIRTEGDSFFVAFRTPSAALRAVVAAQRGLARDWPHGRPLLVRMGLHTGEGVLGGDEYLGIDVNRAARIAAAAWGGQVLLSEATKVLVESALPEGVTVRSRGVHRLKDIRHPEHLYDLVIAGLPADFPPPRSLEAPSNLPRELTSFVGREPEIAEVKAWLRKTSLLTLTGPGGTGKTRLALRVAAEAATEYPDGSFFVDLAPVSDPALVVPTIASALGIREEGWERPVTETLEDYLRDRRLLLVLDNFEQLVKAGDVVTRLLAAGPSLKVMVTSRAPLRLRGEQVVPLTPLRVADPRTRPSLETASRTEAVALFAQRAVAVAPAFVLTEQNAPQILELVARLDGLPLAIELAASRAGVLTPGSMLQRMDRRLPLLVGGARDAPARQQTLRATIGWSYELLEEQERVLFRRLSVLTGGSTVEAAAAVCLGDEGLEVDVLQRLTALAENSLVHAQTADGNEVRFGMLQTVREFGRERLAAEDDAERIERRHAEWFLRLAEDAEANLRGPELTAGLGTLQVEHDNVRAVLRWAIDGDEGGIGLRIVGAVWRFWHLAGHLSEGRRWTSAVLELPSAAGRTTARARALAAAGGLAYWQNDVPAVREAYAEALDISRHLGDEAGAAEGTYNLAFAYGLDATRTRSRSMFRQSREMFERLGNRLGMADALWAVAMLARLEGDFETARRQAEESVRIHRVLGDAFGLVDALGELGRAALELGDLEVARSSFLETLDALAPIGYRTAVAITLDYVAALENRLGRPVRALRLAGAAEALKEAAGGQVPPEFAALSDPRRAARPALKEEDIAAAWEEGRAMTLEEAVAYARVPPASHRS